MFPRRRVVAACLVLTLLGLAGLFLHARSVTPRPMAVGEIGGDDAGSPVKVRAHVHRAWTQGDGDASLVLIDYADFATIRVVARPRAVAEPTLVAPGALVEVIGTVFGSSTTLQIFSEDADGVRVIAPPETNVVSLEFVARNAARLEGERVIVRATVADVWTVMDPRHALLRENGTALWAYSSAGWSAGRANVTGRLVWTSRARCELFAAEEPHVIETTVAALAECPEVLRDQPVIVRDVLVVPGELVGTALELRDIGDGAAFRIAAFVRGWDWRESPLRIGNLVTLDGIVEYQATEARWRIVSNRPPGV